MAGVEPAPPAFKASPRGQGGFISHIINYIVSKPIYKHCRIIVIMTNYLERSDGQSEIRQISNKIKNS